MPEGDGIEETIQGQLRVWLTTAAQLAEVALRAREEALRRMQVAAEREARELASRLAAEQRAAQAELSNVHRAEWWERATPQDIAHAYTTARSWVPELPEAAQAQERMQTEMRTRYDVDPETYLAAVQAEAAEQPQADPGAQPQSFESFMAAREAFAAAEEAAGRRFPVTLQGGDDNDRTKMVDKDEILRRVERIDPDRLKYELGGRHGDVAGWVGLDYDVDRALAVKFPELYDDAACARLEAETERRREAADRAEADRLTADAVLEDRRAETARSDSTGSGVDSTDPRVDPAAVAAAVAVVGADRASTDGAPLDPEGSVERMRDLIRGQLRGGVDRDQAPAPKAEVESVPPAERESRGEEATPGAGETARDTESNPWMRSGEVVSASSPASSQDAPGGSEGTKRAESAVAYDSAERRQQTAAALEARGIDSETLAAHMAADVAQGRPASDAVKNTDRGAPKARKRRGTSAQQKQRGELSR